MDISRMKEFCFLADTLSFRNTAKHFYLSQSVLSKHIALMEEELQAKLFIRDSHHVRLTEQGRAFKTDADSIIAQYDNALMRLAAINDSYRTTINIGYLRNASHPFLAKFVKLMKRKYPDIRLGMRCMEVGESLYQFSTNALDVLITIDAIIESPERYRKLVIYQDRFDAIVGPRHPLAQRSEITSEELLPYRMLLPDKTSYYGMSSFIHKILPEGMNMNRHSYYRDVDTLFLKVETEDYVGFSSEHNIPLFGDKVRFIPITDRPTTHHVCAFAKEDHYTETVEACFTVLEECAKLLESQSHMHEEC